jgi:Uma2 family endonuclease
MSLAPSLELFDERTRPLRLTIDQYRQLMESGVIEEGEPYELLDGTVVRKDRSALGEDPMTVGDAHPYVVLKVGDLSGRLKRHKCHMRTQQPISLPPRNVPEPDGAIVVGTQEDYKKRTPGVGDVLCVIEVADASLRRDRTTKQSIYANAGLPVYFIFNLADRVLELYTRPLKGKGRYADRRTLTLKESVHFPMADGKELPVPLRRLMP